MTYSAGIFKADLWKGKGLILFSGKIRINYNYLASILFWNLYLCEQAVREHLSKVISGTLDSKGILGLGNEYEV